MSRYRVLWEDAASEGRFTDIEADSEGAAAFEVGVAAGTELAQFRGVLNLSAPAVQTLLMGRWNSEEI